MVSVQVNERTNLKRPRWFCALQVSRQQLKLRDDEKSQ